jgi:hypothetical protein
MTLTVETGTGSATAESFISVTDADTYFSNRGNATWAALTDAQKEQNLRKATDYIEAMYRARWKGYVKTATQALAWPRSFVYLEPFVVGAVGSYPYLVDDDIVPTEVKNACAELAYKSSQAELAPDLEQGVRSEKIDVIAVEYDTNSLPYKQYRLVDKMLGRYLNGSGASFDLIAS